MSDSEKGQIVTARRVDQSGLQGSVLIKIGPQKKKR